MEIQEADLVDIEWSPIGKVVTKHAKTYGTGEGDEYVYCYSYPIFLEVAQLKKEINYRIKVGKATGNPINRIHQQISAAKTAISESPLVLSVFQTGSSHSLEKWLHRRLERAVDSVGVEWFYTNPDQILSLYCEYVKHPFTIEDSSAEAMPNIPPRRLPAIASKCVDGFVVYHEDGRPLSFQLQLVHLIWANMTQPISIEDLRSIVAAKLGVLPTEVPAKFDQQLAIELGQAGRQPRFQINQDNCLELIPGKSMPRARTASLDGTQR